jgi:ribosome-binding factor A
MGHRLERIGSVIREIIGEALQRRISDPRVSPFTTITRVDVSGDLAFADVYASVMGSESDQRTTMRGLASARGMLQSLVAKQLATRSCPTIRFHLDDSIKKSIETIRELDRLKASGELGPDETPVPDEETKHEEGD